jgi:hypothetical protein
MTSEVALRAGEVWLIPDSFSGLHLLCRKKALWLTQLGDQRDIVLEPPKHIKGATPFNFTGKPLEKFIAHHGFTMLLFKVASRYRAG